MMMMTISMVKRRKATTMTTSSSSSNNSSSSSSMILNSAATGGTEPLRRHHHQPPPIKVNNTSSGDRKINKPPIEIVASLMDRDVERERDSAITTALHAVQRMKYSDDDIDDDDDLQRQHDINDDVSTVPFLEVAKIALWVLERIGPTMAVLGQDLRQNIQRLESIYESDPDSSFSCLSGMVTWEVTNGVARKPLSCSRAILWLTRSMDFMLVFLQKLILEEADGIVDKSMTQMVEESCKVTLQPWHGWISIAAYKVALKLIPEKRILMSILMEGRIDCGTFKEEVASLITALTPILKEIHALLESHKLNGLKSS